jgi:hypothetical protein
MSSGWLFLDGLRASIDHLRFTSNTSIIRLPHRAESFIIERQTVSKLFVSPQGTTAIGVVAFPFFTVASRPKESTFDTVVTFLSLVKSLVSRRGKRFGATAERCDIDCLLVSRSGHQS